MMNISISEKRLRNVLYVFILSSYIYLLYGQVAERLVLVLSVFLLVVYAKKLKLVISNEIDMLLIVHFMFILSFFLDAILYMTLLPIVYGVAMLIVYFICKNVMEKNAGMGTYKSILEIIWIFSLVILVLSVITSPIKFSNYAGVFGNSNGMGTLAATLGSTLASLLAHQLWRGKKRKWWMWIYYIVALFFCVISSCRSALIIFVFQIVVLIIAWIKGMKTYRKRFITSSVLFALGILLLVYLNIKLNLFEAIYDSIIEKFFRLAERGDVSNGRMDMWLYIFEESKFFGSGELVLKEKATHNVYFGLMNQFGKFTGILYFVVIVIICYRAVFFTLYYQNFEYNFLPVMMAANFFVGSMVENFLMTPSMLLFYLCIPIKKIYMKGIGQ